jgi:hypothetical protein
VSAAEVVAAWHDALNAGDVDRLAGLSTDDVEVGGPRGAGRGVRLLREWVERARIELQPGRAFQDRDRVVVEQRARWLTAETGQLTDPVVVASAFLIRAGRVASVIRHADLAAALEAAGLTEADELP